MQISFFFSGASTTLKRVANSDEQFLKGSDRSSYVQQPKSSTRKSVCLSRWPPPVALRHCKPHTSFFRAARPNSLSQALTGVTGRQGGVRMEKGWRKRNVIFSEQEATCNCGRICDMAVN